MPALIPIIIFCSFGFRYLHLVSYKILKRKFKSLTLKKYSILFIATFAIASIAKVWYPRKGKSYIKSAGYFIKEHSKKYKKEIVVINNLTDQRFLYYANAKSANSSLNRLKEQVDEFKKENRIIYIFLKNRQKEIEILQKECNFKLLKIFKYKEDKYQLSIIN